MQKSLLILSPLLYTPDIRLFPNWQTLSYQRYSSKSSKLMKTLSQKQKNLILSLTHSFLQHVPKKKNCITCTQLFFQTQVNECTPSSTQIPDIHHCTHSEAVTAATQTFHPRFNMKKKTQKKKWREKWKSLAAVELQTILV